MNAVFLFPGQGSQQIGMGRDIALAYPDQAGRIFRRADEILGFPLSKLCFDGPEEELTKTEITQPSLFTTSVAILTVLEHLNVQPLAAAGHSVGEYAALVAAGALTFEDGLPLVRLRGEVMAAAVADTPGAMAAILGLDVAIVESICHEASSIGIVEPSNLNGPTQIVVSGQTEAVEAAMDLAKDAGGKAIRLKVSAPFHCSMMRPAADQMRLAIEEVDIRSPRVPVIANATGRPVSTPDEIRQALKDQIESPVLWTDTMAYLLERGFRSFLEIGPGKVLAGLMRSIDRSAEVRGFAGPDDIEKLIAE